MHHTKIAAVVLAFVIAVAGFAFVLWPTNKEGGAPVEGAERSVVVGFNQSTNGLVAEVTPLELLEDSRCPLDVQCIQAGTVRILVAVGASPLTQTLVLGKPLTVSDAVVTLTDVSPAPYARVAISLADYRFTFSVEPISESSTGTLLGSVGIGPLCGVGKDVAPCNPSPEVYAAQKVYVYKADKKTVVAVLTPDDKGAFTMDLPIGEYWIDTVDEPSIGTKQGVPTMLTIRPSATTVLSIVVDTGIR